MIDGRRPPRLLVKTLTVTFLTVALLLGVVFVVVTRQRAESGPADGRVEPRIDAAPVRRGRDPAAARAARAGGNARRQRDAQGRARHLPVGNARHRWNRRRRRGPRRSSRNHRSGPREASPRASTPTRSCSSTPTRSTLGAAGRMADRWPREPAGVARLATKAADSFDGVARMGDGRLSRRHGAAAARRCDDRDAVRGDEPRSGVRAGAGSAGRQPHRDRQRRPGAGHHAVDRARLAAVRVGRRRRRSRSTARSTLDGESYAFRRLVAVGDTVFYALGSIDESSQAAMRDAMRSLALVGVLGIGLAAIGSFWLARLLSEPIGRAVDFPRRDGGLARRLRAAAADRLEPRARHADRDVQRADGVGRRGRSSRRKSAYTGAIRALAAALDARDPYTAGHSDRVSVLSVAICRQLNLPAGRHRSRPAGRAAARHRQDWRARRRAAETWRADRGRIRHHQAASGASARACCGRSPFLAPHISDRRAPSRAAGRPGISPGACAVTTFRSTRGSFMSPTPTTR